MSLQYGLASRYSLYGADFMYILTDDEVGGPELLGRNAVEALADSVEAPGPLRVGTPIELDDGDSETVPGIEDGLVTEIEGAGEEAG